MMHAYIVWMVMPFAMAFSFSSFRFFFSPTSSLQNFLIAFMTFFFLKASATIFEEDEANLRGVRTSDAS